MVRKTLCEATCKITVAQKSTRLSRAKYTALQYLSIHHRGALHKTVYETLRRSAMTRVRACLIFARITRQLPKWWTAQLQLSIFHLESFLWHYWQSLRMRAASRSKSPSYKPQAEPGTALPGTVLQLAVPYTWMLLSPSDHLENYPVWLCLLIQPFLSFVSCHSENRRLQAAAMFLSY